MEVLNQEHEVAVHHTRRANIIRCLTCTAWVFVIGIVVFAVCIVAISARKIAPPEVTRCDVMFSDSARPYPMGAPMFKISFNAALMQPHWVAYVQPIERHPCSKCGYFRKDPYGIDDIRHEDYTNTGYDRGHLVPNADFGNETYIISNAVPMVPKFNRGAWRISEAQIRGQYIGKLIFKGCEYSATQFIMTARKQRLYIPLGCSFIVFESPNGRDMNQVTGLVLLDYGYFENTNTSSLIKKLPSWVACRDVD